MDAASGDESLASSSISTGCWTRCAQAPSAPGYYSYQDDCYLRPYEVKTSESILATAVKEHGCGVRAPEKDLGHKKDSLKRGRSPAKDIVIDPLVLSASVYYRDENGVLRPYDSEMSKCILDAAGKGDRIVKTGCGVKAPKSDLRQMKKLKRGRSPEKDIVIEVPWNARIMKGAGSLKRSILRKVHEMALDRIREVESVNKILDLKTAPGLGRSVRVNPYLGRGHLSYDNFVDSLHCFASQTLYDAVLEIASDGPTAANLEIVATQGLRLAFHGTNEASIKSIMKNGLFPTLRKSDPRDWFAEQYAASLLYTWKLTCFPVTWRDWVERNNCKLLLFMVLPPWGLGPVSGYITSDSNLLQLPLAEVTIDLSQFSNMMSNPHTCN